MVLLQLEDILKPFVKRREFLLYSGILLWYDMKLVVISLIRMLLHVTLVLSIGFKNTFHITLHLR